ncbi:RNA-binding protein cabeza-like protein [Colletotrichum incanum]|nr:RNA-binding protein cabeza-like protein [Colletotrichum incanum]
MAPKQKNASKASKLKTAQAGIQKANRGAKSKKSVSRASKKTATQPSAPDAALSSTSNAEEGDGEWIWTENPPTKEQTARNGRQRGRNLVQWNRPDTAMTILLNVLYEAYVKGIKLPMDAIAHRTHCGASGQSLIQYLARERKKMLKRGRMCPPVAGSHYDPTVRGVVIEPTTEDPNAEREISFREPYYHQDFPVPKPEDDNQDENKNEEYEEFKDEISQTEESYGESELDDENMSQEAKGRQVERSYPHAKTMASQKIDFQQQNPQQILCAPQNYQISWTQPQSPLPAPLGTVNPLHTIKPFGTQALETPHLFRQGYHWNGFDGNLNSMPSMPSGIGSQEIGLHETYGNTAAGSHSFEDHRVVSEATPYGNSHTGSYLFYNHHADDLASDTAPYTGNPMTDTAQGISPPHGLYSSTPRFTEQENGGGALDDVNFAQWVHE